MWPQMASGMWQGVWPNLGWCPLQPPLGSGACAWPPHLGQAAQRGPGAAETPANASRDSAVSSQADTKPKEIPIFLEGGVEEVVAVPRRLVGRVVGKHGQTIAEVREKSGCWKVDATDQSSDPCHVKIAGTADAVKKARELIKELTGDLKVRHAGSEFVEISQGKIGKVIGMKGAQVNEIEAITGTKIDIDYEREPCKVYVVGNPDGVKKAKEVLLQIANEM